MFSRGIKLTVETDSDVYFLPPRPNSEIDQGDTGSASMISNTLLTGTVRISAARATDVHTVRVELLARHCVTIGGFQHTSTVRVGRHDVAVNSSGFLGNSDFAFAITIPWNAAPSEKTPVGRTSYRVVATTITSSSTMRPSKNFCWVTIVSNHSDQCGTPAGFDMDTTVENKVLGHLEAHVCTSYLIVSGFLDFDLRLPSVDQSVNIEDIKVAIEEVIDLHSIEEPNFYCTTGAVSVPLWSMKASTGQRSFRLEAGQSYHVARRIRLPDESTLRASTPQGAVTGMKISHKVAVIILYTPVHGKAKREAREFRVACGATVSSCLCTLDMLQLPAYSEDDASPPPQYVSGRRSSISNCLCNRPEAEVVEGYTPMMSEAACHTHGHSLLPNKTARYSPEVVQVVYTNE